MFPASRPNRVDEHVELTVATFINFVEHMLDGCGGQSRAATAAGDGGGVLQPEIHDASALGARPVGLALLGKCDRALPGVIGGKDRNDEFDLFLPRPDTNDLSPVAQYR
jgi:hypothetical protein